MGGDNSTGTWQPISTGTLTSGNSAGKACAPYKELTLYFRTTAVGTTLDVLVQSSPDNSNWFTIASHTQITATGNTVETISANIGEYVRLSYTASGTFGAVVDGIFKT